MRIEFKNTGEVWLDVFGEDVCVDVDLDRRPASENWSCVSTECINGDFVAYMSGIGYAYWDELRIDDVVPPKKRWCITIMRSARDGLTHLDLEIYDITDGSDRYDIYCAAVKS